MTDLLNEKLFSKIQLKLVNLIRYLFVETSKKRITKSSKECQEIGNFTIEKEKPLGEEINHEDCVDQILGNEILNPLLERFPQFKKEQEEEEEEKKEIPSIFSLCNC